MTAQPQDAEQYNRHLVDQLRQKGCITSVAVERAFLNTPRHLFLAGIPLERAYADQAVPTKIVDNRVVSSASQPAMIAIMLEQLALQPGQKVLEIGAGTGYNAALMARIVGPTGHVTSLDIDEDLVEGAQANLAALGLHHARAVQGDGAFGFPQNGPYDRIILTVGAADISPHWWSQLTSGGRMVLPLALGVGQKSIAFDAVGDHLASDSVRECAFIKLRGAFSEKNLQPIQVGPEPGLELIPSSSATQLPDPDAVYAWLAQRGPLWNTGVPFFADDLYTGLDIWLTLQEPDCHALVALGEMVECKLVPPLILLRDDRQYVGTRILCSARGMAALTRAMQTRRQEDAIQVQQFGEDEELVSRLFQAVHAWEAAGRPSVSDMRIRVYPKEVQELPPGQFVIENEWTYLIFDWPQSPAEAP